MTAISRQLLPTESIAPLVRSASRRETRGWATLLAGLLGFVCLLPYPAVPIGHYSALQMGNVLTLLMVLPILWTSSWSRRPYWIYLAILVPMAISGLGATLAGSSRELDLCLKAILLWGISCLTLVVAQFYLPRYFMQLLTGAALATLVHTGVGFWQMHAFSSGEFPFLALYNNPSFLSIQDNAPIIARYIQRPFGLFPEPSAMSSSLAPWIVFWFALELGVVRMSERPARWRRWLFNCAAMGGLALMIFSRSGHAMVAMGAIGVFTALWLFRCKATWGTYLRIVLLFGIAMPLLVWMYTFALQDRVTVDNGSWEERASSLVSGFSLIVHGNAKTILLGLGAGLSVPAIRSVTEMEAIWSVSLTYLFETGLLGAIATGLVALYLLHIWHVLRYSSVYAVVFVVWLIGITLTTSYEQLLSLWLTLGWFTVWPTICPPKTELTRSERDLTQRWSGEQKTAVQEALT